MKFWCRSLVISEAELDQHFNLLANYLLRNFSCNIGFYRSESACWMVCMQPARRLRRAGCLTLLYHANCRCLRKNDWGLRETPQMEEKGWRALIKWNMGFPKKFLAEIVKLIRFSRRLWNWKWKYLGLVKRLMFTKATSLIAAVKFLILHGKNMQRSRSLNRLVGKQLHEIRFYRPGTWRRKKFISPFFQESERFCALRRRLWIFQSS